MIDINDIRVLDVEKRKEKLIGSYFIYEIQVDAGEKQQIVSDDILSSMIFTWKC